MKILLIFALLAHFSVLASEKKASASSDPNLGQIENICEENCPCEETNKSNRGKKLDTVKDAADDESPAATIRDNV